MLVLVMHAAIIPSGFCVMLLVPSSRLLQWLQSQQERDEKNSYLSDVTFFHKVNIIQIQNVVQACK